jgi:hypothetical protein
MIRKTLHYIPTVTITAHGAWWLIQLHTRRPITTKFKPSQLTDWDPKLSIAGADAQEQCYSVANVPRTIQPLVAGEENQIHAINIQSKIPKDYVVTCRHRCLVKAGSQAVCLVFPTNYLSDAFFAYHPSCLPDQFQPRASLTTIKGLDWKEENLQWLQAHPDIHIDWPQSDKPDHFDPQREVLITATDNRLTRDEWEKLGCRPITRKTQKNNKYNPDQVATFREEPYRWQVNVPATSIEEAKQKFGLTSAHIANITPHALSADSFEIVNRQKATILFPFLSQLPTVTSIGHKYSGFGFPPNAHNLAVLEKAYNGTQVFLAEDRLHVETSTDIEVSKVRGYLYEDQCHNAYTSKAEYPKWFIPVKEAQKTYRGITATTTWYVHTEAGSQENSYLLSDLVSATKLDPKQEKKHQMTRREALIQNYPHLPRHWKNHTDTDVKIWQEIHRRRLSGEITPCTLIPLFANMDHSDVLRTNHINEWFAKNDPQACYDPIDKKNYCLPYASFDDLATLPNFDSLISYLFKDPLIPKLILSERAKTVLITNLF